MHCDLDPECIFERILGAFCHGFGISKDTPGIGTYEMPHDGQPRALSPSLAPGTHFSRSKSERFGVYGLQTAAHVGPGAYSPECTSGAEAPGTPHVAHIPAPCNRNERSAGVLNNLYGGTLSTESSA